MELFVIFCDKAIVLQRTNDDALIRRCNKGQIVQRTHDASDYYAGGLKLQERCCSQQDKPVVPE